MEKMLRCVVVDDEIADGKLIHQLVRDHPRLYLYKWYFDSLRAMADISSSDHIDIAFIDVQMPGISGIDLARQLRDKFRYLVFATAYDQYAVEGYTVNADAYLLKPISQLDFNSTIIRILSKQSEIPQKSEQFADDSLYLPIEVKGKISRVQIESIQLVRSLKGSNYLEIFTNQQSYKIRATLDYVERLFDGDSRFMRVSRSEMINLDTVREISGNQIHLFSQTVVIGTAYRERFMGYVSRKMSNQSLRTG
ncbi:LytR/AlgR family response regulator transcription factor [Pedobacter sp. AW1-32]|uniref:LytR/AlgR family response regulator transcription factor n=1 Tax=Pedobacter sp. AW1-32 TaxID=3383026 RepID=UPI003FF0B17E